MYYAPDNLKSIQKNKFWSQYGAMNNIVMQAQKSLMNAFKFDEADLEANRMGQFSERQRVQLVKEAKRDRQELLLHSPMIVICIVLIAQFGFSLSSTVYTKFAVLLFTVFLSVIFVGKVILTLVKIELQRVEGPIFISDPSENENGKDESRGLYVGNQGRETQSDNYCTFRSGYNDWVHLCFILHKKQQRQCDSLC
jgi:hypothetical protein